MKNIKKILSVLLALCLLLSLGTFALAADETPTYNWQSIPTSAEGLKAGDIYLNFDNSWCQGIVSPCDGYAGLHTAECMSAGTWFVDVEKGLVKGTFTALADYTSSGEDETVVFDPSTTGLQCALIYYNAISEAGIEWLPVAKTTAGLKNGDLYIDTDKLIDEYIDCVVSQKNFDDDPSNDITPELADEMREVLREYFDGFFFAELYINPHGTLNKYKFISESDDPDSGGKFSTAYYCPLDCYKHSDKTEWATFMNRLIPDCIKQYHEPEISWITLPYGSDGLSEGEWYLDTKAFIDIIGKGKNEEEKAAALATMKQHVAFFFNPDGDEYVYKYVYTELPLGDGTTVSGSVVLPHDLTESPEEAFPYDYNALRQCVRQYTAPAEPESDEPSVIQTFVARLKSIIQTILSFFRKIFK